MGFWKRLFQGDRTAGQQPFDGICRDSLGIDTDSRLKPAVSATTVEMMTRMRRKVDDVVEAEIVREAEGLDREGDIEKALSRFSVEDRLALMKAELGIGSPEQPDLIPRGPATAEGGCER